MVTMATLTPLLKRKVDELFLHWFSEVKTQKQLRNELTNICGTNVSLTPCPKPNSPTDLSSIGGLNINNRPSSPPIPPASPTTTPRSPRRRTSSNLSQKGSRKSFRQSLHEEKRGQFYPGCAKDLKQFYFPNGEPPTPNNDNSKVDILKTVKDIFDKLPKNVAKFEDFKDISKACKYSLYWKFPLFFACGGTKEGKVTYSQFATFWQRLHSKYHDDVSQFFFMLTKGNKIYLESEDFEGLLQDIINTHPGLQFLVDVPEFHSRYIITVIERILYGSWDRHLTLQKLRRSNFLAVLNRLEEEEDINQIVDYFSYEHFYVIYCKFWELDTDHDMVISKEDLSRYSNGAISSSMIDRLFSGCITRKSSDAATMSYLDFVWFILSEVDKATDTGIEYWFRCLDLDGNGIISMYELEYFYEDQLRRMEDLGMETLSFQDCICQMLDLVKPAVPNMIALRDLKNSKLAPIFFDTFFNLEKWLEYEQKDPFQANRDENEQEVTEWDKYVAKEYELLVAEEGGTQDIEYEDDFEEDDFSPDGAITPIDDSDPRWSIVSAVNDNGDDSDGDETFY